MNKKLYGVIFVTLIMIATGITVAGTLNQEKEKKDYEGEVGTSGWGWYNPLGSWMRSDKYLTMTVSYAGLGKYSIEYEYIHSGTWEVFGNLFPTVIGVTDGRGDLIVKSKNIYDFSLLAIGYDENYQIVYYSVYSGTSEYTGEDTSESTFTLAFYGPDQDPFCEEEEPIYWFGPFGYTYERIPVVPPCET